MTGSSGRYDKIGYMNNITWSDTADSMPAWSAQATHGGRHDHRNIWYNMIWYNII